jgi:hypothetical protein
LHAKKVVAFFSMKLFVLALMCKAHFHSESMIFFKVELEVTLPGEGKDRVFMVAIRWTAQVSLYALEEALDGKSQEIPNDAILALDVVMRHLPSMK